MVVSLTGLEGGMSGMPETVKHPACQAQVTGYQLRLLEQLLESSLCLVLQWKVPGRMGTDSKARAALGLFLFVPYPNGTLTS